MVDDLPCQFMGVSDIRTVVPYAFFFIVIVLSICSLMLFYPVIFLVRKVIEDMELLNFKKRPQVSDPAPKNAVDDISLLDIHTDAKDNESIDEQLPSPPCLHKFFARQANIPIVPPIGNKSSCEIQFEVNRQMLHFSKVFHDKANDNKVNDNQVNDNQVNNRPLDMKTVNMYCMLLFVMSFSIFMHMCVSMVDDFMRAHDYRNMWLAIESAVKAANGSAEPLIIMADKIKKMTSIP